MSKQLVFGLHAVTALLHEHPERILHISFQKERRDKKMDVLFSFAKDQHIAIEHVTKNELDHMTHEANHQGVVAFCKEARVYTESDLKALLQSSTVPPFLLILDGVQDPHNLGACLRSADAAGVHAVIAPKDKAASITPIVSKVASGAAETLPFVQVTNLVRVMEELKKMGIWIYGAEATAEKTLYQTDLSGPIALVLGGEGQGLRRLTREHCDGLVNIPMRGSVSSLNVSVAAGIFLFEVVRQRQ